MRVLLLGGTAEARGLATALTDAGVHVITSLAGRVRCPAAIAGQVRIGGFGGVDGLEAWLRAHGITAVVDATHPFAARITASAAEATAATALPLLVLHRPSWAPLATPQWRWVDSLTEAAALLPELGKRVFLTTGRTEPAPFADLDDLWFLVRSVEPPEEPMPRQREIVLDRGPFLVDDELSLMRRHRIDVLVTKDSGGALAVAKLTAARTLGIPVVIQRRPPLPEAVTTVGTVADAVEWVLQQR
ncbi:cobalt-precorrin-6A reductase [Pseudonocardia thermophila]|uniref:cobalt-precorrin-6A reductase n=1 Tax=Pseudonocardia thermophila TaxID=1848 RepID=UPI00248E57BD|nr:cobalt-precorrin-6A reductase [Pseudonocardia thermophila]